MNRLRVSLCALSILLSPALSAQYQVRTTDTPAFEDSAGDRTPRMSKPTGCVAAIPPASMRPMPVYLHSWMPAHTDPALVTQAGRVGEDVGDDFRTLLGAPPGTVPMADTNFVWYSVPTSIVVVAHRNGDMVARAMGSGGDSAATLLLLRAFGAARARGAASLIWPKQGGADSLFMRLSLLTETEEGRRDRLPASETITRFPVFSLTEPEESEPLPLKGQGSPRYPKENGRSGIEGFVLMQFVVDTLGQAELGTIRDLLPDDKPLRSNDLEAHEQFVQAVRDWLPDVHFRPARIGKCAVKQIVQMPIEFKMPGSPR